MVTGAVPAEFSVRGKVDAVFTVTLPNARLAGLIVNCELVTAGAFSCRVNVLETLSALAVSVTACADVTDDIVAVNPALVAFAGTINVAGTATAAATIQAQSAENAQLNALITRARGFRSAGALIAMADFVYGGL